MTETIENISTLAPWIYGLCGLAALYFLFRVRTIRNERRQAIFSLEREQAARILTRVSARAAAIVCIMAFTYTISAVLAKAVEEEQQGETAAAPETSVEEPAPTPAPPAPAEPQAAPAAEALVDLRSLPECDAETANIQSPGVGQEIAGTIAITGTATAVDFADYRLEIAPGTDPADQDFTLLRRGLNRVRSGQLHQEDTSNLITGPYTIRLRVLNNTGTFVGECLVNVRVVSG